MERRRNALLALTFCASLLLGSECVPGQGGTPPSISVTLNALPQNQQSLMVVPPSGFVINVTLTEGSAPIDLDAAIAWVFPFAQGPPIQLSSYLAPASYGLAAVIPAGQALAPGSYTLLVSVLDEEGRNGFAALSFAVRNFLSAQPPIGTNQFLWYDFEVDRDGNQEPDFAQDLQAFGLGSPADPTSSDTVRQRVTDAAIARLIDVFWWSNPNGLGFDPVLAFFSTQDPGIPATTTRICVGGQAPSQPNLIGAILIDRNNGNKASVECGTIPPTGIFPRGLLAYGNNAHFINAFGPFMPSLGGTPVGEDPLDVIVLAPGFDPQTASPEEAARYAAIEWAIDVFATALGNVTAHETGHALGLVEPGAPGGGLFGGTSGANLAHNVEPDGTVPTTPFLMNAGGTLSFPTLAGVTGSPLTLRALSHAYLRDRVVQDPTVTAILPPPVLEGIDPTIIDGEATVFTVTGSGFEATPSLSLIGEAGTFVLFGESFVSETEITGFYIRASTPPGFYTVQVQNPDGQVAINPSLVVEILPY